MALTIRRAPLLDFTQARIAEACDPPARMVVTPFHAMIDATATTMTRRSAGRDTENLIETPTFPGTHPLERVGFASWLGTVPAATVWAARQSLPRECRYTSVAR